MLTACVNQPRPQVPAAPIIETKNMLLAPPGSLLQPCDLPKGYDPKAPFKNMIVTHDIVNGYLDWFAGGRSCGAQVNRIIQWYKDAEKQLDN